jgi:hypothetical protein
MSKTKTSNAKANHTSGKAPKAPKKPIDTDKAIRETITVFEDSPAVTFAFLGEDGSRWIGPNLISPIGLAQCAFQCADYDGPYPESEFQRIKAVASKRRTEIVTTVKKQLRRLQKLGVGFLVLWQAYGESDPHIDYSTHFADADASKEIGDLLAEETNWLISS